MSREDRKDWNSVYEAEQLGTALAGIVSAQEHRGEED